MKEAVLPVNRYVSRTHTCGELTLENVGEEVKLSGWMEFQRMGGKFIILRDSYGSTQLLIPEDVCKQLLYLLKCLTNVPYKILKIILMKY